MEAQNRYYATGKRKTSVARVWLTFGTGKIVINHRNPQEYFRRSTLEKLITQPLELTDTVGSFDIFVNVHGGGLSGQAGAIRHGIAKALVSYKPEFRPILKKAKLLTRDSRVVERKKYGRPKARKSFQWTKR